ncbi:MAG TPA: serine/threonine-protein kinase [Gemmatimonadaceae bacterium]|nr:serine/threonine-protein kinase [Gemmatimonadaceae bacterium]
MTTTHRPLDDHADWAEIERLFAEAIERPRGERAGWISLNATSEAVRAELEAMIAAHERVTGVLDRPLTLGASDVRPRIERALGGRYTIVRPLGRGGSATVFLAREYKHERNVVIKVLHPEIAARVGVHRFLREVRIAAQLAHPHILPLIDSGEADGLLFYVMPHLEGETLRDRLTRVGRIPVSQAVALLRDVADGLRAAHAAGIVHRDLKPENVLCAGDHAYLIDFGIAARDDAELTRHTQEGVILGTIGHMSPEQSAGESVGPPSDIYAWGVIAREMLTGLGPLGDQGTRLSAIPPQLATLVRQALAREAQERPASAAELLARLTALDVSSRRTRVRRASFAAAVLAIVAVAVMWLRADTGTAPGLPLPIAVAPLHNETGDTTLGIWARMAGDWLTQGLHETSLVRVVPWPSVRQAWEQLEATGKASAQSLAGEIGAGTVVTGSYYKTGDRIGVRLDVTDPRANQLIASLPAIVVARDSMEDAVRELRDRLMGFVALRYDERASAMPGLATHPPTFHAYRAFDRGLALYNEQEYGAAAAEFRQAWSADTSFPVPLIYAAMAHWNRDEYEWVDTLVTMAMRRRDAMSEYDQKQVEHLSARLASDGARAIAAGTRAVEIAPESRAAYNLGRDLIAMDRAAEGRRVLEAINPDRGLMKGWQSYWTQLTHARHLTGAHELELEAARAMRTRFPEARVAAVLEARALAVLGRTDALDSLLSYTVQLPGGTYWSHAAALVVAGEELAVHHDTARGTPYLLRAVAWLDGQLRADPGRREHLYWLGSALYDLGRWREADATFTALHRDFPDRFQYRGLAALARARVGDMRGAERLLGDPPRFDRGEHTAFRARLAAIAGDSTAARTLFQRALGEIVGGYAWLHASAFRDF